MGAENAVTETLKPTLRYLKRGERLTTIIAVRCRDGIILSADSQETSDLGTLATKQAVSKILPVRYDEKNDPYCLLGCSGVSTYIDLFRNYVGKAIFNRESRNYFEALDIAVRSYTRYVTKRKREMGIQLDDDLPSAIFAGYEPVDQELHVYVLSPPHPPEPLTYPYRAAIGSGSLYAHLLFNIAELLMNKMELKWNHFSTNLVAQFSQLLLGRVMSYDSYSGMGMITFRIDTKGCTGLSNEQIFPSHGKEEKYRLTVLLKTLLSEVPPEKLLLLTETYNLSKVIGDLFSER